MADTTHHETHGILNSTLTRSVLVLRRRAGFSCGSARLTVSYRFSLTFHVHLTEGKEGMTIYTLVHTSCLRDSPRPAWIPITLNSCSSLPTHPIIVLLSSTLCRYFTLHRLMELLQQTRRNPFRPRLFGLGSPVFKIWQSWICDARLLVYHESQISQPSVI